MRTIFVRVTNEDSPSYAPVLATPITSTTFSIEGAHPNFADVALEFGAGDSVRCKVIRLLTLPTWGVWATQDVPLSSNHHQLGGATPTP